MDYCSTIRRMIASLAYRTRHAFHEAPVGFEDFDAGMDTRTPTEILNHMNGLIFTTNEILNRRKPHKSEPVSYMEALETFHMNLSQLDATLQEAKLPNDDKCLRLVQGPLSDVMTHVGQLTMLRRLMGSSVSETNYYRAEIVSGVIGPKQPLPTV